MTIRILVITYNFQVLFLCLSLVWIKFTALVVVFNEYLWYLMLKTQLYLNILLYTGCPRRNVPDFRRVFLMLKYTNITQNTYIQSWTVTEIMARGKYGLLAVSRTVPVQLTLYVYSAHVLGTGMQSTLCLCYEWLVTCMELQKCLSCFPT